MASRLWVPVASGPLGRYAGGYGSWLAARGYSRWTIAHRLWQLELLSRWLEGEGLSPGELTSERVLEFLAARRAAGYSSWLSVRSTALPLEYLREVQVVPVVTAPAQSGRVVVGPGAAVVGLGSTPMHVSSGLHSAPVTHVTAACGMSASASGRWGPSARCLSAATLLSRAIPANLKPP